MDRMLKEWLALPEQIRRKVSKKDVEEHAEMAALFEAFYQEALRSTPLTAETLEDVLCVPYRTSDHHLVLELSGVMTEKPEKLQLESLSVLKAALVRHKDTTSGPSSRPHLVTDLEEDAFKILEGSVQHDLKAISIWLDKMSAHEAGLYWQKLEFEQSMMETLGTNEQKLPHVSAVALLNHAMGTSMVLLFVLCVLC